MGRAPDCQQADPPVCTGRRDSEDHASLLARRNVPGGLPLLTHRLP